jgi:hypothetical protein
MPDAYTQLNEYSRDYGNKMNGFGKDYEPIPLVDEANDSNIKKNIFNKRKRDLKSSTVPKLYSLLKKNAEKIMNISQQSYPVLGYDTDINMISNSPNLSKTLVKHKNILNVLANRANGGKAPSLNNEIVFPCLVSHDGGRTQTDFFLSKFPHDSLQDLKDVSPGLSKEGLDYCRSGRNCYDCLDCKEHKKVIKDSINGIYSPNKDDDNVRLMHVKNLISTLNNWASHQDSRGGNEDTAAKLEYDLCYDKHQTMSTNLRNMADDLHNALDEDYKISNGTGGGKHRDNIYGNNGTGY